MYRHYHYTYLEDEPRSEEDVEHGEPEEGREGREESAAKVKIVAAWSIQGREGEAGEHNTGPKKSLHDLWGNNGMLSGETVTSLSIYILCGVDNHGQVKQRAKVAASEESKGAKKGDTLQLVLAIIGSHHEPQEGAKRTQSRQQPSPYQCTVHVGIPASCRSNGGQSEGGVHILKVLPHWWLPVSYVELIFSLQIITGITKV
ncbi:hypothetical protein E2C01_002847 [Portunus trituberculatus]|uniref:Uncharacterized protein n=1 Tax=Portunus trituberculatus TaxID=210409 RepID=A0A5B7CNK8_PORTR|nr:hypothetical protein [Portunus trituberculatus]